MNRRERDAQRSEIRRLFDRRPKIARNTGYGEALLAVAIANLAETIDAAAAAYQWVHPEHQR